MNITKTLVKDLNGDVGHRIVNRITENIAINEELRFLPLGLFRIDNWGNRIDLPSRLWGFDPETAPYPKMISYFTDARVTKRSPSLKRHVLAHCMVRFPVETARDKTKLIQVIRTISITDFDILFSEAKNEPTWFSDSGFQDRIWPDPNNPINRGNVKFVKLSNERFEIRKK